MRVPGSLFTNRQKAKAVIHCFPPLEPNKVSIRRAQGKTKDPAIDNLGLATAAARSSCEAIAPTGGPRLHRSERYKFGITTIATMLKTAIATNTSVSVNPRVDPVIVLFFRCGGVATPPPSLHGSVPLGVRIDRDGDAFEVYKPSRRVVGSLSVDQYRRVTLHYQALGRKADNRA